MSNSISEDCSSNLHNYCTPCQCDCHEYNHGGHLTPEECYYLYKCILSTTFIPRDQYSILRLTIQKIHDGIGDYKPTRESEFKE